MNVSDNGLALIAEFEGLRLEAYKDGGGVPTIGYGHTQGVKMGDKISQYEALNYLRKDVTTAVNEVNRLVKVSLTQNQFDALVDFEFNTGGLEFVDKAGNKVTSTLLRKLNSSDYTGAALEFLKWNHDNGKVVDGLTRRCQARMKLFES